MRVGGGIRSVALLLLACLALPGHGQTVYNISASVDAIATQATLDASKG